MKVMISQPRYLCGYHYLSRIASVDKFIVYDNVQRVARGYENRNQITNLNGEKSWLTVPVASSSRELIKKSSINGLEWKQSHIAKISECYQTKEARMIFEKYLSYFDEDYSKSLFEGIKFACKLFQIDTEIILSSTLSQIENGGKEELINLVKSVGGTKYVSGVNCIEYGLTHEYCKEQGIELIIDYCNDYRNFVECIDTVYSEKLDKIDTYKKDHGKK